MSACIGDPCLIHAQPVAWDKSAYTYQVASHVVGTAYCYRRSSAVCLSVGLSRSWVPQKAAEVIDMPSG